MAAILSRPQCVNQWVKCYDLLTMRLHAPFTYPSNPLICWNTCIKIDKNFRVSAFSATPNTNKGPRGLIQYRWKQKNVNLTTWSSLVAPKVVSMATYGATSDDKVVKLTIFCFQWGCPSESHLSHVKCCRKLAVIYFPVAEWFWEFAKSTAVILPGSVQNFEGCG